jgi:DNA-binding PadR family transcriptional regulator
VLTLDSHREVGLARPLDLPDSVLPLSPVALHVLLALAGGAGHGYAIAQEVERASQGSVRLGPGTLYGSLQRLAEAGLIEASEAPADVAGAHAERRRYYALTALGVRALRADAHRLARAVKLVQQHLGPDATG